MTEQEGWKICVRLLGPMTRLRRDPKAPTAAERDAAAAASPGLREAAEACSQRLEARRVAVLEDDYEYQTLRAAYLEAKEARDTCHRTMARHRLSIGREMSLFFHVFAEADNWQDLTDKLRAARDRGTFTTPAPPRKAKRA